MDRGAAIHGGTGNGHGMTDARAASGDLLQDLTPQVLAVLVRRGADFATAEDAVQEALLQAVRHWPEVMPDDPKGWLIRVAGRKLIDAHRAESTRRLREVRVYQEPESGPTEQ